MLAICDIPACACGLFPVVSYTRPIPTIVDMNRASQVLAKSLPPDVPRTQAALSERGDVPLTTLYYPAHGRPSARQKAQRQQYLTTEEEKALVTFLLLTSNLGLPVRIKYIPSLAFSLARKRFTTIDKLPGKNQARAFKRRHLELKARRVKSID